MAILVTGGAGYIGSHVVKLLGTEDVVVVDNLSTGHPQAITHGKFIQGDLQDEAFLDELFGQFHFEAVIHFAASIVVPESVANPLKYYRNNTLNTHRVLTACQKHSVKKFIFSSTAAVYGNPAGGVCSEETPTAPINPYGSSKLMSETVLRDLASLGQMNAVILRYFNVAGADPEGLVGQSFPDATHLIKVACQAATGKRPSISVFGTDYPTPDGTCVRDYIHVSDLALAHVQALNYLRNGGATTVLNCGYGKGFSVTEVLAEVKRISGVDFKVNLEPRRAGDPPMLIAKATRIREVLDWNPQYEELESIVRTALEWERNPRY
jgi:UDP-glucose 4-epimerase